ncbi:MAG TPA: histone deacetylase [Pirellulaceae bacterium]|nr:histone deacetylase [Pirellulaceae bacterium]
MNPRIVYDRRVNLGFPGSQRLHPFDLRKYARAWAVLRKQLGSRLAALHLPTPAPASDDDLRLVHSAEYLQSLQSSAVIAQAIEVPALRRAPLWLLDRFLLQPMRWAAAGSVMAARAALECGLAFNLGGGFHHAKPAGGEGFSIYNDIALIVRKLTREGRLAEGSRVVCVDLDAHLGNGVAWCFHDDPRVFLFDMHNALIYPMFDVQARERIDCPIGLAPGTGGGEYLEQLRSRLPPFLDSISRSQRPALAIYNAGTDVLAGDELGGLSLTPDDVLARDLFVLNLLRDRQIPAVMLTSGGYTQQSYQVIARTIAAAASH